MSGVGLVDSAGAGGQPSVLPPSNSESEKFPELDHCLLHNQSQSGAGNGAIPPTTLVTQNPNLSQVISSGRPPSLSIQSVASSSEYSTWSDFDSRRSSIISSVSSYGLPSSQAGSPQKPATRTRRDAKQLHAARLSRSGSTSLALASKKEGNKKSRFQRASSNPADALAATEPPHKQGLTSMAFAEQQRWITVQQKTFTKWLNTKLEIRDLEVKDLVTDLSDGVCLVLRSGKKCLLQANS